MGEARPAAAEPGTVAGTAGARSALPAQSDALLGQRIRSSSLTRDLLRRVARNPGAVAGAAVLATMILLALFASQIAPYDPIDQDSQSIRARPSRDHLFGADSFGRDVFSRVLYGGRKSLPIGLVAVGIAALVGVPLGLAAGYYGRRVDAVIMRGVDLMLAFPGILLAMSIVAILGSSLFNLMLAVGIGSIPEYTRVVRGSVLSAREQEYVLAARVSGAKDRSIMFRHILPNVLPPVIVLGTLGIAGAIILGSTLSFLGLGIQPPTPEWGNMLQDGRSMMRHFWWVSFFPGLAIMLTVLAINLLGDGLRDALDPRLRGR
jgi:peptide/nickel transport system permease protein